MSQACPRNHKRTPEKAPATFKKKTWVISFMSVHTKRHHTALNATLDPHLPKNMAPHQSYLFTYTNPPAKTKPRERRTIPFPMHSSSTNAIQIPSAHASQTCKMRSGSEGRKPGYMNRERDTSSQVNEFRATSITTPYNCGGTLKYLSEE